MNPQLRLFLGACIVLFLLGVFRLLVKKDLNVKYSIAWLAAGLGMLIILIFPQIVDWIGQLAGIIAPVNTTFLFAGMFGLLIVMTLTVIVSRMSRNARRLAQEHSLLEARVRELETKIQTNEAIH